MKAIDYYDNSKEALKYLNFCKEKGSPLATRLLEVIQSKLGQHFKIENGKCVDLACGSGTSILTFSELGFAEYLGIDFANEMLALLPGHVHSFGLKVKTVQMDLHQLIIPVSDNTRDMVTCCAGLMYVENVDGIFKEAFRVLKSGGLFGFNIIAHNGKAQKTYSFLDRDSVTMHIHPSLSVYDYLSNQLGFEHLGYHVNENDGPYVPGIDGHEVTILLRKK